MEKTISKHQLPNINIPVTVLKTLKGFGITALPEIKDLTVQYITDSGDTVIDWHYFTNWVAMHSSDH